MSIKATERSHKFTFMPSQLQPVTEEQELATILYIVALECTHTPKPSKNGLPKKLGYVRNRMRISILSN